MKKLSLKSKDQRIWFVADLHLGHAKDFILGPRGYTNVDEALAHQWLMLTETIKPTDIVFNLGDAVIGAGERSVEYAKRVVHLPCKQQYYLWGNHNAGMQQLYDDCRRDFGARYGLSLLADDIEVYPLQYPGSPFIFVGDRVEVSIDGHPNVLDHYPIASWNHLSKGGYNIHGHCHRNLKEDRSLKRLDVGWEWLKRPVEWNEIVRELAPRKAVAPDHHGNELFGVTPS